MTPQTGLALGQIGLLVAYFVQAIRVAAFERKLQKHIARFRSDGSVRLRAAANVTKAVTADADALKLCSMRGDDPPEESR